MTSPDAPLLLKPLPRYARVSVALCSFNGESYIGDQLESILQQSLLPSEVIISDDGSKDKTVDVATAFAKRARFPVGVYCDETNKGFAKNFEFALERCSGDIIFLCDQDDVWVSNKLEVMLSYFRENADLAGVFSDGAVVDAAGTHMGYTLWQAHGFSAREQTRFLLDCALDVLLKHEVVTGATLAVRSEVLRYALPIPDSWAHDAWIALVLACLKVDFSCLRDSLILYRQHGGNEIGAKMKTVGSIVQAGRSIGVLESSADRYEVALARVQELPAEIVHPGAALRLRDKVEHLRARLELPGSRLCRVPGVMRELANGRYGRYSPGIKAAVKDILLACR